MKKKVKESIIMIISGLILKTDIKSIIFLKCKDSDIPKTIKDKDAFLTSPKDSLYPERHGIACTCTSTCLNQITCMKMYTFK